MARREFPDTVIEQLRTVAAEAGVDANNDLIERVLRTGIGLGVDGTERGDLKIATSAITEMRSAFQLFARYRDRPKVTIFGSARTQQDDVLYTITESVAAALAKRDWMVVTGAGPGIMQAAAEGAGAESSIGVSIRLPFEAPNAVLSDEVNLVTMRYFFTRKLMLVKESSGFICVPGGFGTLDELFELLTLQQTGKATPVPIVLLDREGGSFWTDLRAYADKQLIPAGVIAQDDFDRILITESEEAAAAEVTGFWRNYHSLRWVQSDLVLRLRKEPSEDEVRELNERFGALTESGIRATGPLPPEVADGDDVQQPRLVLRLKPREVGRLHKIIRGINELPSAPAVAEAH
ncbi:TIGR00730 family Rossman fold protein [uncultured Agrococcus sp.]|uniref:LOG family protein n=1 Tax=uncultured Agrococcus sp. TaxID=382258 RepID=UPI0025CD1DB3|nr:TIGR00730 family Rossman fold protein [uncultured Agrococcus sp.]